MKSLKSLEYLEIYIEELIRIIALIKKYQNDNQSMKKFILELNDISEELNFYCKQFIEYGIEKYY